MDHIANRLKGSGLGARSFENGVGVTFAPRQQVWYDCPRNHHFTLVFHASAELPNLWDCPRCGREATRQNAHHTRPTSSEEVTRTHWDMLRERRSLAELETLLQERLTLLQQRPVPPSTEIRPG